MNLFRTLSGAALTFLLGASLTSCLQAPNYPDVPRIEEKSVTVFRRSGATGLRDSIEIALNFEDGNGDLGLDNTDTTALYAYNGGLNRYYENYFLQPYYKNRRGIFVPLLPANSFNGRFIRLMTDASRPGPIRGVLRRSIIISLLDTAYSARPGTEYRFDVIIADRALHESNKVTTKAVPL